jgi:tripartite-type tricarboxylate transporter receptor subunit TctC
MPNVGMVICRVFAAAAAVLLAAGAAPAQTYPAKPIRLIVPAAPGGITDISARITADYVGRALNERVVVENKAGAGGNLGVDMVAKSPPDGYTLVMVNVGNVTNNPWLYKDMPFDAMKDLVGVAIVGDAPHVISVNVNVPVKTLKELIGYAKANPGKLNYGSAGNATMPHLAGALFARIVGIDIVHIPYRGAGPAAVDLGTGQVQLGFIGYGSIKAQVNAGTVRMLSVSRAQRQKAIPDVPTTAEAGMPDFQPINWFGVMAPSGTPGPVIALLNKHINAMLDDPEVQKRLEGSGIEPMKESPEQLAVRIKADYQKWGEVIRGANIRLE